MRGLSALACADSVPCPESDMMQELACNKKKSSRARQRTVGVGFLTACWSFPSSRRRAPELKQFVDLAFDWMDRRVSGIVSG